MANFSVFETGAPSSWHLAQFPHPAFKRPVPGKRFLAEALGLTGMELSLNHLPPKAAVPFLHTHRAHEELYLFLSGQGELLIDGERIVVQAGTAVRVAPDGKRAWRNTSDEPLVYLVVQAKAGTLSSVDIHDGQPCAEPPQWA